MATIPSELSMIVTDGYDCSLSVSIVLDKKISP
ncbi:hypothetical protein Dtox_1543 [Desulfofarcimen acetoxidans DSM 771]|uniref:Uncharacterized protein n=1 Tax=Desulfofarcimen acetoxidans (strain ATCC 49208 / DSM 771 / KCTC 5769 / VKM B-1644 / 5575) TaxID=485916 RepID=C8VW54_DESAS|nr:hypothetical protein Dtox_1543 [Desulfofarcimen acetoxidans DSM 771]